jgi:ribonucleotide monophosphatase NagD (HAD superfamily)
VTPHDVAAPPPLPVRDVLAAPSPSDEPLSLPVRLIAPFPLAPDRRHAAPGPVTEALVAAAAETYADLLAGFAARGLPLICANPDLVVDVGGRQYLCAGAIADLYERMDGEVFWAGKPHTNAYETARATAERLRGKSVPLDRIIAIGDSVRTDMNGAQAFGIPAVFVASGIHREETMQAGSLRSGVLERLFAPPAPVPLAVMERLAW